MRRIRLNVFQQCPRTFCCDLSNACPIKPALIHRRFVQVFWFVVWVLLSFIIPLNPIPIGALDSLDWVKIPKFFASIAWPASIPLSTPVRMASMINGMAGCFPRFFSIISPAFEHNIASRDYLLMPVPSGSFLVFVSRPSAIKRSLYGGVISAYGSAT